MLNKAHCLLAFSALVVASSAFADRHSDDAASDVRDDSLWSEKESYRNTNAARNKVGIGQTAGQIIVDGRGGKSGGAAYISKWKTDWNDSFSVNYTMDFSSPGATTPTQSAVSGIAFGNDSTFSLTKAFRTGVTIEARETVNGRTLQIVARKSGRVIASTAPVALADGVHDFEVSWVANPFTQTIAVKLYDGIGTTTPVLTLDGVERSFSGRRGGISSSLFGYSTGNLPFECKFDDFSYSGDDSTSDDTDDDSWCDSDDSNNDGIEDGDDHGGRGGDDSMIDSAAFTTGLQAAIDASAKFGSVVLKAEGEDGGLDVVVKLSETEVRVITVNLSDSSTTSVDRPADAKELDAIAVSGSVTVGALAAIDQVLQANPGATMHSIELEEEHGAPEWKISIFDANGLPVELTVAAS